MLNEWTASQPSSVFLSDSIMNIQTLFLILNTLFVFQKPIEEDEGSDDSTDWGSDSESDTDSSDDDTRYASLRERFLKRYCFLFQHLTYLVFQNNFFFIQSGN